VPMACSAPEDIRALIIEQGRWLSLKRLELGFPKGSERPTTAPVAATLWLLFLNRSFALLQP
jgi:hypothetical protein